MKTVMGSQKIPIRSKIKSALFIYHAHKNKEFSNAKRAVEKHHILLDYLNNYVGLPVEKARILEIGCGQRASQVALFHGDGAKMVGIDIDIPTYRMSFPIFLHIIRLNGIERALKSLLRHILFDRKFFAELSKEYGKPIMLDDIDIQIMDATDMAFKSSSFNFIFSNMVFQHIDNIAVAVKEVNRVLNPSGIAIISIHLFPSISGGICLEWLHPDQAPSKRVPAWDHLRNNKYPANVYLNKLTINQYRDIFRSFTNVIEEQTTIEGENLLTTEIESELRSKGYTREDLLTRIVTFFVRKKVN